MTKDADIAQGFFVLWRREKEKSISLDAFWYDIFISSRVISQVSEGQLLQQF